MILECRAAIRLQDPKGWSAKRSLPGTFWIDKGGVAMDEEGFIVDGYSFETAAYAELASNELESIEYLAKKINYGDINQVFALYNKFIDEGLFKTQIGYEYLKKLQNLLYKSSSIDNNDIRPIPIKVGIKEQVNTDREVSKQKAKSRLASREAKRYKGFFSKSLIINFILVIAMIAMLIITATSSNPNILNYENKLQDRYASWEESLKTREEMLDAREKALQNK